MGYVTEAFIFSYLGLTFFSYSKLNFSPQLFFVELGVILFGRFMGTVVMMSIFKCCGYEHNLNLKELVFICYAGLIRGAIAFGLVLTLDDRLPNRDVIVTTSLTLVVFTTVTFGSTCGILQKVLFKEVEEAADGCCEYDQKPARGPIINMHTGQEVDMSSVDLSNSDSSYQRMLHPN